jgi:hypothetical protein
MFAGWVYFLLSLLLLVLLGADPLPSRTLRTRY